jgi:hypothetical protein
MNIKSTPIIINEDKIPEDLKRYVASIRVWNDDENTWWYYIFKKTLLKKKDKINRKTIINAIKSYQGSSRGNNIPTKKLLEDWEKSSKAPEIELLYINPKISKIGLYEQFEITKHREYFPDDLINSKDNCYNRNNGTGGDKKYGVVSHEEMMSYISCLKLKKEINRQREEQTNVFEKVSLSRERLLHLEKIKKLIQARVKTKNKKSVSRYASKQEKLPSLKDNFNNLIIYQPEYKNGDEEVGDGSQSYYAFKKTKKHDEMWGWAIPYEWHKHILPEDKEKLGNWFNHPPEDVPDYRDDEDILRSIRNILVKKKDVLINENGVPIMDHEFIDDIFDQQGYDISDIQAFKNLIKKEYKDEIKKEKKYQDNSYDFSDDALDPDKELFSQEDKDVWDKLMEKEKKKFPDADLEIKLHRQYIKEKINDKIISYYKGHNNKYPKKILIVVWFDFIAKYEEYKNSESIQKDFKILKEIYKPYGLEIVLIDPEKKSETN